VDTIRLGLLRGVCQLPAYVAHAEGFLREAGVDADLQIASTAWAVPQRMHGGDVEFAVIPWTRVATDRSTERRLTLICGSGVEEAAMVLRRGVTTDQVRVVAVPQEGGIKDLTAMALVRRLGWERASVLRMPSGDGAILAIVGEGADAATMVEPYATMLAHRGLGDVVQRTSDVWPGAPGCSLTTTSAVIRERPDLVERVVAAYVRGAHFVAAEPDRAARIGARFIGVGAEILREALRVNRPDPAAIRNQGAMDHVIGFMIELGYLPAPPTGYRDLRFLDRTN
jgi:ABC-type nitrate/sulfonate/bicarbonate transport system substrate-binding protein